jgi:predicted DNA-binding transcriptional regulator AlpA
MIDMYEDLRVVDEPTAILIAGLSPRTWDRLRSRGEAPPMTKLSERRRGYRLRDLREWLDARRVSSAYDTPQDAVAQPFAGEHM